MIISDVQGLSRQIARSRRSWPVGRISAVEANVVHLSGLTDHARIGDRILVHRRTGGALPGEVVKISNDTVMVLPEEAPVGVAMHDRAILQEGHTELSPSFSWIGRVIDPLGRPLDGAPLMHGGVARELHAAPPPAAMRRALGRRIGTGLAAMNTFLPLVTGQRMGLFAGSGVGKSRLLAHLARWVEADVIVLAFIGERGREVGQFVVETLGAEGMSRSVVIAAASDQSALMRRRCAWSAMTVAEHFRDMGLNVLLLADSITRFAEAHREIAAASGEASNLRGFPASTAQEIMSLCERAGPGCGEQGDITALFSVLVAGSDMDEPVADILRGVLDGHIVLDRQIAERGRYPAIDITRSVSRSLPDAATEEENSILAEARQLLSVYEQSHMMIKAGLYSQGSDPTLDRALQAWPDIESFLTRSTEQSVKESFDRLTLILRRARATGPQAR